MKPRPIILAALLVTLVGCSHRPPTRPAVDPLPTTGPTLGAADAVASGLLNRKPPP